MDQSLPTAEQLERIRAHVACDVYSLRQLLIPIHWPAHWACAAVCVPARTIVYCDSMCDMETAQTQAQFVYRRLLPWLEYEWCEHNTTPFDSTEWQAVVYLAPQQNNGSDCGFFVNCFLELLSHELVRNWLPLVCPAWLYCRPFSITLQTLPGGAGLVLLAIFCLPRHCV